LIECAGKRDESEPLLARENGEAWTRYYWRDLLQVARKAAGLGDDVVMYSLRHCAITEMIVSGIDPLSVARLAGTSIAMIQNHYGHLMKDKITAQLALVKML
jgi:site-specific recombinase XerD